MKRQIVTILVVLMAILALSGMAAAGDNNKNTGDDNKKGIDNNKGNDGGPREMHKEIRTDCGQETEVPFVPSGDRPVYCRECYQKHKPQRY
jgi:CxxC-x17-CxxC domain-containing protein